MLPDPTPTAAAAEAARRLAPLLAGFPPPHVAPIEGGGIQYEWTRRDRDRDVEIEVRPDGTLEYLRVEIGPGPALDDFSKMVEGPLSPDRPDEVRGLLEWLHGAPAPREIRS